MGFICKSTSHLVSGWGKDIQPIADTFPYTGLNSGKLFLGKRWGRQVAQKFQHA